MTDPTWSLGDEPQPRSLGFADWCRVFWRGALFALVVFGGLILMLILRVIERPLFGQKRPITPWLTVWVCRLSLVFLGLRVRQAGKPMQHPGVAVCNHASWLDIFSLNSAGCLYFVSKSEVASWPGIGWLAKATGTVFIRRDSRDAVNQKQVFEARLLAGHRLLFFPEGTSTDGLRVLPFKPTLFAALFSEALREKLWVQPVTLTYFSPDGSEPRHYAWWGDMAFGGHLLQMLATKKHGRVETVWHTPLRVADFADRKALARACEEVVRGGHGALIDES